MPNLGIIRILLLSFLRVEMMFEGCLTARILRFTVHSRIPSPGMRELDANSVCWDHGAA